MLVILPSHRPDRSFSSTTGPIHPWLRANRSHCRVRYSHRILAGESALHSPVYFVHLCLSQNKIATFSIAGPWKRVKILTYFEQSYFPWLIDKTWSRCHCIVSSDTSKWISSGESIWLFAQLSVSREQCRSDINSMYDGVYIYTWDRRIYLYI